MQNPYFRALLCGSVILCLLTVLIFNLFFFSDKAWILLIALVRGIYVLSAALLVTLLTWVVAMCAYQTGVQLVIGFVIVIGITALSLEKL